MSGEHDCPCQQRYGDYNLCRGCGIIVHKTKLRCDQCQKQSDIVQEELIKRIVEEIQIDDDSIFNQKSEG